MMMILMMMLKGERKYVQVGKEEVMITRDNGLGTLSMNPPATLGSPVLQIKHCKARHGHRATREDHHIDVRRIRLCNIQQPRRNRGSNQVSKANASVQQTRNSRETVEAIDVGNDGGDDTEVASTGESVDDGEDSEDGDGRGD